MLCAQHIQYVQYVCTVFTICKYVQYTHYVEYVENIHYIQYVQYEHYIRVYFMQYAQHNLLYATDFYFRSYCLINMFRAPLCPLSGAQEYYTVVAACGIWCCKDVKSNL